MRRCLRIGFVFLNLTAHGAFAHNKSCKLTFSDQRVMSELAELSARKPVGHTTTGHGETVIVDFVSPNLAKPLDMSHFRSAVIGEAVRRLAHTQGFNVIGINHLGDWGPQFGHLVWAYQVWGHEYDFVHEPFQSLYRLYVRVKKEKDNPELERGGREIFRLMQEGNTELLAIWQKFREITVTEDQKVLDRLKIRHDLIKGESEYNTELAPLEARLTKMNLLVKEKGALGVKLGHNKFALLRTQAGTSVYAEHDLAAAIERLERLQASQVIYVAGSEQSEHFHALFEVLSRMQLSVEKFRHVSFGHYLRSGEVLTIDQMLDLAISHARQHLATQFANASDLERAAEQLGLGALVFNDLSRDRHENLEFDLDRDVSLQAGGPYVQLTTMRASREHFSADAEPTSIEIGLAKLLLKFPETLTRAFDEAQPHLLAQYLLQIAQTYESAHVAGALGRESIRELTVEILTEGLRVLNIEVPSIDE